MSISDSQQYAAALAAYAFWRVDKKMEEEANQLLNDLRRKPSSHVHSPSADLMACALKRIDGISAQQTDDGTYAITATDKGIKWLEQSLKLVTSHQPMPRRERSSHYHA